MLQLRETLGWTQEDLAKAVGVSRQTINGIEKGTQKPSFSLMAKICRALGQNSFDAVFRLPKEDK